MTLAKQNNSESSPRKRVDVLLVERGLFESRARARAAIEAGGVTADGSFFYVMDYISGRPLDEIISGDKRPTTADTLRLFGRICEAVNAALLRIKLRHDANEAGLFCVPAWVPAAGLMFSLLPVAWEVVRLFM